MRQNREAQRREAGMRCKQRGQALVEFALVISFLLVPTVVGLGALTGYIRSYIALTDAVSIAAQTLSASRGQTLDPCALAVSTVEAAAPYLGTGNYVFTTTINGTVYANQTSCLATSSSSPPASYLVQGVPVIVKVVYGPVPYILTSFGANYSITAQTTEIVQ